MNTWLRRVITALGVLAAVNLVACTVLLTWLFATDRMDGTRFGELTRWIQTPVSIERAAADRAVAEERAEHERAIEFARLSIVPRSSQERASELDRDLDHAQIRRRLLEEQARLLGHTLDERMAQLREAERVFDRSAEARQQAVAADEALRNSAQFRKTVALLDASPSKQVKEWMLELIRTGRHAEAVRYLDAMSKFAASRLLRELKSVEETALAADLLEALRRRNLDAPVETP